MAAVTTTQPRFVGARALTIEEPRGGRSTDWAQTWRAQRLREAAEGEAGRRLAAEAEAVRRRAAAVESRRRRKAEAKAASRREAEAATARAAAERTAAERATVEHAAAERAAAEHVGVVAAIAALEWRVAAEESAAFAALAAIFEEGSEDGRRALPSAGCGLGPRGGSSSADAGCTAAPGPQCRAGGCRALPRRGRRRPHMRWRARRESYYIRRSPPVLLQQCRRGMLNVCMATPRPGG